ncbi:MAG TPA: UDP-N-acetylmuramoyl-L-alanyl-D-glutamate--2,6-diaminopimelate ligase [Candidatus Bathyarchaeia archaeon]|nr:UDP-N-acetylmuramoyl-L-alanyl-D-glutamate--2,6-diaminopimelate ligase [Candidatus Bathyarchaeia archaeon]
MTKKIWVKFRHSTLGEVLRSLIPNFLVKTLFHFPLAFLAVLFYRFPAKDLKVIGVTGTDGKTTTATLIYHLLVKSDKKAALISTVSAKVGLKQIPTGFHVTSPHPWKLQRLLREIADQGYQYLILETTSHGLDQHRLFGVNFLAGVITNVTPEHLDYHQTYQNYLQAKAKLFRGVKMAVLNRDDRSFDFLKSVIPQKAKIVTYGIENKADFTPQTFEFDCPLVGEYNQYNCLAAIATATLLGLSRPKIRKAIATFSGLAGRMEKIDEGQAFEVFVDFAHTPNALENVLKTLKKKKRGKLMVVFGCAGERDQGKRPVMGEIASRLAEVVVLTAEDPRTEETSQIISQIVKGCQKAGGVEGKTFFQIPDRKKAIEFAVKKAKEGDLVVICGKGHEKTMCFGRAEYPWSDQKEARKALRKMR